MAKDTRKYHVVRVNGWTETVIKTFDDEVAAVKEMNSIGRKNQVGIIATVKGDLTEDFKVIHREQIGVYDEWLNRILRQK